MKRIKIAVLLVLLCVLAGCSPKDTSLRAYCTESQQEFLDQSLEELPVALTYRHNDNILGRYETTDEEIISEILQALRETTIVSKAFSGSTDSRILEFETADGDTCLFWFDENRFHGAGGTSYVLSGDEEIWDLARKFRKHIRNTGKRWSKKGTSQNQAFLTCIQLRLCKQGTPGLFIPIFQRKGLGFSLIYTLPLPHKTQPSISEISGFFQSLPLWTSVPPE